MDTLNRVKGIIIALFLFSILHYSIFYYGNTVTWTQENHLSLLKWINYSAISIYFLCGLVASIFYKKNYVLIGSITGLLSAIIAISFFGVAFKDINGMLITAVTGVTLGAIGGLVSLLIKSKFKNVL